MKQILLLIIAGLVVAGCCSTQNELQYLSTSDLQLRRYELMYCLSMARMSWDKQPLQGNAHDDVQADLDEKEAIEREITRRGVTNYHWPPSATNPYAHDIVTANVGLLPSEIGKKRAYITDNRVGFTATKKMEIRLENARREVFKSVY